MRTRLQKARSHIIAVAQELDAAPLNYLAEELWLYSVIAYKNGRDYGLRVNGDPEEQSRYIEAQCGLAEDYANEARARL
jgi:hypothetical protein